MNSTPRKPWRYALAIAATVSVLLVPGLPSWAQSSASTSSTSTQHAVVNVPQEKGHHRDRHRVSNNGHKAPAFSASARATSSRVSVSGALGQGIANYNKGYIQKAIPLFEQAAATMPGNEQAQLWLARAYNKQGLQEDAKSAYLKVLALNPNNVEALSTAGELYTWDLNNRDQGIRMLKQVMALQPDNAVVAKKLSQALFWINDFQGAYQYASPIAPQFLNDRKWLSDYAQILTKSGHADDAVSVYENNLNILESKDLTQLEAYDEALLRSGQTARAAQVYDSIKPYVMQLAPDQGIEAKKTFAGLAFELERYNDVVELDHNLPVAAANSNDVQMRTARALMKSQRTPEAIDSLQKLYQAGKLTSAEKLEYADYLQGLNLAPEALPSPTIVPDLYQQAIKEDNTLAEPALRLAQYYRYQPGHFMDAVRAYGQAIEMTENRTDSKGQAQHEAFKKELLDFLKTNKSEPAAAGQTLQSLVTANPGDYEVKGAYAEFLSFQQDHRQEAIRTYLSLIKEDPTHQDDWRAGLDRALSWHKPSTDLIPLYQEVVNTFPNDKAIWLTVARAYASNPDYYNESLDLYSRMMDKYPDDVTIHKEWVNVLQGNVHQRASAMRTLAQRIGQHSDDWEARTAYGRLLSYEHRYGAAFEQFNAVLSQNPEHRDALIAKGYALMWSGRKLEAKQHFIQVQKLYPNDIDVAIGLAQANKFLGRYDQAFDVMKKARPEINLAPEGVMPVASQALVLYADKNAEVTSFGPTSTQPLAVTANRGVSQEELQQEKLQQEDLENPANWPAPSMFFAPAVPPVNVPATSGQASRTTVPIATPKALSPTVNAASVAASRTSAAKQKLQADVQDDINSLQAAIDSLDALQHASKSQLNRLEEQVSESRDHLTAEISVNDPKTTASANRISAVDIVEDLAIFSSLNNDTNPLLSGLGRFRNDDLSQMESGLRNDLRPLLRVGYDFLTQSGEATTSRIRSWGFPNQVAFSLSPQIRARFGVNPYKYYIPTDAARDPSSTWSQDYYGGMTAKLTDRLTADGDFAITHYNQSRSNNINYQAYLNYDFNDSWHLKVGSRRMPQFNSLLNVAGLRPNMGAFAGKLLGQARETGVFTELSWTPTANVDVNAGYEWAHVDGQNIPNNNKNAAYFSPGYTLFYAAKHKVRLGYEFYYMGYAKNTTTGFFDTTSAGVSKPVVTLDPVTLAQSGVRFGGYFSPQWFIQNAGRLDFRGSFFDQFLEYKLGGSLGVQTFGNGHGIRPTNTTALTASADLNLIMNLTDWLALYGFGEYLDAGAIYTRWRFGGGLILRPAIDALSPVFHKGQVPHQSTTSPAAGSSAAASPGAQ